MATTGKKSLSSDEVSVILKSCGESRVAELQFGGLYVRFHPPVGTPSHEETNFVTSAHVDEASSPAPVTEITEIQRQVAKESLELQELQLKQEQIAHALVEDPALAEELLIKGELEKEDGSEDGYSEDSG